MIFKSKANLTKHLTTCKVYKDLLTEQKHQHTKTALETSYEQKIQELNNQLESQKQEHETIVSSITAKCQISIDRLNQEHHQELQKTIQELKQDTLCQVKLRETDLASAINELSRLKDIHTSIISERDILKRKVEDNEKEIRYLTHKAIDITSYNANSSAGTTNITNTNVSQVQPPAPTSDVRSFYHQRTYPPS